MVDLIPAPLRLKTAATEGEFLDFLFLLRFKFSPPFPLSHPVAEMLRQIWDSGTARRKSSVVSHTVEAVSDTDEVQRRAH